MSEPEPQHVQMPEAVVIAWDRAEAGLCHRHDIVRRYSRQHVVVDGGDHTLCGARIPWLYWSPGDGTRCERCYDLAARRGLHDHFGQPIGEQEASACTPSSTSSHPKASSSSSAPS